jgi:hypothetical protein
MHWRKAKATWLGTYRETRGKWHGIPYVLRLNTTMDMTRRGWTVVAVASMLLVAVILIEELLI